MNKKTYAAIVKWVEHKSLKNFFKLYKDGFLFNRLWTCPLWRIWRIIRNTITKRYDEIAKDKTLQKKYGGD
jgi:hypothetical protein